jgi:pyridoxine/pyridoxamine 5'-phosphate oxidase
MINLKKIKNKIAVLSSVKPDNKPYSIAILISEIDDKKVIITDNYMQTTIYNLRKNPYVSLVYHDSKIGIQISGKAKYYDYGKWLEYVKRLPQNKGYPAKGALLIEIEEIKELV